MGTSSSFAGSAGSAWQDARAATSELVQGDVQRDAAIGDVVGAVADALVGWELEAPDEGEPSAPAPSIPTPGPELPSAGSRPPRPVVPRIVAPGGTVGPSRTRGGGGGTPTGGGRGRAGTPQRLGSRRSVPRAARIAAATARAAFAFRSGDRATLAEAGLDLAELAALPPADQCNAILNAIAGEPSTIQEDELRSALQEVVVAIVTGTAAEPAVVIELFVTSYIYQICLTEIGRMLRWIRDSANVERRIKDWIRVRVQTTVARDAVRVSARDMNGWIADILVDARELIRTEAGR